MSPASILFPLVVATEWILGALIVAAAGLSGWATRRRHDRSLVRVRAARDPSRRNAGPLRPVRDRAGAEESVRRGDCNSA